MAKPVAPVASSGQPLKGVTETYERFMAATRRPNGHRIEDRGGKLIGGQFEYGGWEFWIRPVSDAVRAYKTIGYQLIVGGESKPVLGYTDHRPYPCFGSLTEARRAAFWYLSGEEATALELGVFCQIFRELGQVAWLLEKVGGTLFRNQLVDRDLQEWSHQEIAAEALCLLLDLEEAVMPSEGDRR